MLIKLLIYKYFFFEGLFGGLSEFLRFLSKIVNKSLFVLFLVFCKYIVGIFCEGFNIEC